MHKYTEIKSIILSLFHLSFFVLFSSCSSTHTPFAVVDTNKALSTQWMEKHLFTYNYAVTYPPQGVDTAYKRSGFIHPLRTLEGEVLTNCSPSDHYHHFGLWYAWTKPHSKKMKLTSGISIRNKVRFVFGNSLKCNPMAFPPYSTMWYIPTPRKKK